MSRVQFPHLSQPVRSIIISLYISLSLSLPLSHSHAHTHEHDGGLEPVNAIEAVLIAVANVIGGCNHHPILVAGIHLDLFERIRL